MENSLFDAQELKLIFDACNWKFVSSILDTDLDFVVNNSHQQWMKNHHAGHYQREILFPLKGESFCGFRKKVYPCRPGTIFLFNSYESHDEFYHPATTGCVHLWIHIFEDDVLMNIINVNQGVHKLKKRILLNDIGIGKMLIEPWDELVTTEADFPDQYKRARIISSISSLLLCCVRRGYKSDNSVQPKDFQDDVIRMIQKHMAENLGAGISLEKTARLAGYSKFHFLRMFKEYTGCSFHDYINLCRKEKFDAMHKEGFTKSEISSTLGFSGLSAFSRWLKNMQVKKLSKQNKIQPQ
jgi:AraC-like DNA-binding protein